MSIQKAMDSYMVMSQVYLVHVLQISVKQIILYYELYLIYQNFTLKDATGEEVKQAIVSGIT